jgi:hypothetical protein
VTSAWKASFDTQSGVGATYSKEAGDSPCASANAGRSGREANDTAVKMKKLWSFIAEVPKRVGTPS